MTQLESARNGIITPQMKICAKDEEVEIEQILKSIADGTAVIPANKNHSTLLSPIIIGKGYRVKVNANIGTSFGFSDLDEELKKLKVAIKAGTDSVMDLSTWGNLREIRKEILKNSYLPIGSVPIYSAAVKVYEAKKSIVDFSEAEFINIVEEHAKDGIDFMTIHAGVTKDVLDNTRKSKRIAKMVSRGGSIIAGWMVKNNRENPFFAHFDDILAIAKEYDVTISLGDGLRPGAIIDSTDAPQISELLVLGELVERARSEGVQVMVEGPGHIFLDQIEANVKLEKSICKEAPFFVLGPIVTDIAPAYDHITSAIGGAIAAMYGADFLCYVTPNEHLGLPDIEDVKEGVIAAKIAAHAANLARRNSSAIKRDREMALARTKFDWEKQFELSLDPEAARQKYSKRRIKIEKGCSMCGPFCALKITEDYLNNNTTHPKA
jgi:phosphomethylpyrimidine synthase